MLPTRYLIAIATVIGAVIGAVAVAVYVLSQYLQMTFF